MPVPQAAPFGRLSDSVQTASPVEQLTVPTRQGLPAIGQAVSAAQSTQAPSRQTRFVPQTVPLAWGRLVSVQDDPPSAVQTISPS